MYYFWIPFIGWLCSGVLKFAINYVRFRKSALKKIGNGGFPSTHTTIITSTVMAIGLEMGFNSPVFGLGIATLLIVIIDATGLRRLVGKHSEQLNKALTAEMDSNVKPFRESMGHNYVEVLGGLVLGIIIGFIYVNISIKL